MKDVLLILCLPKTLLKEGIFKYLLLIVINYHFSFNSFGVNRFLWVRIEYMGGIIL